MMLRISHRDGQRTLRSQTSYTEFMFQPHERLQRARERAGYTSATAAAEAFGWPVSTYLGHENGSRGLRRETLSKYAKAYGVSPSWILGYAETDAAFDEVVRLLSGIKVVGVVEAGAYRPAGVLPPGVPEQIHVSIVGYEADELQACYSFNTKAHTFLIATKSPTPVLDGDEVIISKRDGDLFELTAWQIQRVDQGFVLAPLGFEPSDLGRNSQLDDPKVSITGIIIARLDMKVRARALSPDHVAEAGPPRLFKTS